MSTEHPDNHGDFAWDSPEPHKGGRARYTSAAGDDAALDAVPDPHRRALAWILIAISCVLIVLWLKVAGLVLAAVILGATYIVAVRTAHPSEVSAMLSSIRLSAEDISDVISAHQHFLSATDTDAVADRTLTRPALADPDCADPDIEAFYFELATAKRFLTRLQAHLQVEREMPALERLLSVTDRRALELQEKWALARRAAQRLGPEY